MYLQIKNSELTKVTMILTWILYSQLMKLHCKKRLNLMKVR